MANTLFWTSVSGLHMPSRPCLNVSFRLHYFVAGYHSRYIYIYIMAVMACEDLRLTSKKVYSPLYSPRFVIYATAFARLHFLTAKTTNVIIPYVYIYTPGNCITFCIFARHLCHFAQRIQSLLCMSILIIKESKGSSLQITSNHVESQKLPTSFIISKQAQFIQNRFKSLSAFPHSHTVCWYE